MKTKPSLKDYIQGVLDGDVNIVSRAITLIESKRPEDKEFSSSVLNKLMPHTGKSIRLGITGAPGAGKSTFIDKFGQLALTKYKKLAVLAVDPSSSRSHGSIMGDKTRMNELLAQESVYVRPSPAGVTLGGVAAKTREAMLVCEAAGYDFIIIETVGVGQSEIAVKNMVDYILLLLSPTSGDELQGIKRGIIEIADGISITKADGASKKSAEIALKEYSSALRILGDLGSGVPVTACSSLENTGLEEILVNVINKVNALKAENIFTKIRNEQLISWLHDEIKHQLNYSFYQSPINKKRVKHLEKQIRNLEISPKSAAVQLFE